jgi:hypothetical protein
VPWHLISQRPHGLNLPSVTQCTQVLLIISTHRAGARCVLMSMAWAFSPVPHPEPPEFAFLATPGHYLT